MIDDVLFRGFVNGKGIKNGGEIGLVVAIEAEQRGQESGTLKQNTFVFDSQCWKQNIFGSPILWKVYRNIHLFNTKFITSIKHETSEYPIEW